MYDEKQILADKTATETTRAPQVFESIEVLDQSVNVAQKMLEELEVRLAPVLRNEPQAACGAPKDMPTAVPLAARVNDVAMRISLLREKIGSINRRLEV